ncbi:ribosome recycling factor [Actinomyces minihominis]|uniref:ribosome recycling factor n=1 Tax=Actinomyces minihominis TaxID=2002838 RepID=UPI000C07C1B2|nr:ribosome recycling factor [Actinomyces minihominis]
MIDEILLDTEDRMGKAVEATQNDFASIRTGRANPAMFTSLMVDYYGAPTPLQQLATINIPEARTVLISPFDRNAVNEIIHAIRESDLGVNPNDDGKVIRVILPALTEDRRKEYVKQAKTRAEEGRIAVRAIRRKSKDQIETLKKDGEIGEDEAERAEKALEATTKEYVDMVDAALASKEAELLTV